MKTLINYVITFAGLIVYFIIPACEKKDTLAFISIKQELVEVDKSWTTAEGDLRILMENIKVNMQEIGKLETDLSKLLALKSPKIQHEVTPAMNSTRLFHDSLRLELTNLNEYIHEWNAKADELNELSGYVESKSITPDEASALLDKIKEFKAQADLKRQKINSNRLKYETGYKEMSKVLLKYKK